MKQAILKHTSLMSSEFCRNMVSYFKSLTGLIQILGTTKTGWRTFFATSFLMVNIASFAFPFDNDALHEFKEPLLRKNMLSK